MAHATIGRKYNPGKLAPIECVANDKLKNMDIHNACFLLLYITEGRAAFRVTHQAFTAVAPCFVCFDESESPMLVQKHNLKCHSIYFHPQFLNINMSFPLIHSADYTDIAFVHDLFLLKPFTDQNYIVPITEAFLDKLSGSFFEMKNNLEEQQDWYWSCRARSAFMEIMLVLERLYSMIDRGNLSTSGSMTIRNEHLKRAVLFLESHYADVIRLSDVVRSVGLNHTSLTQLFKEETGVTPMEYLWTYRIRIAKKHLAFTNIPLKEISVRCGFKTTQHFSRIFKEHTDKSPAQFRKEAVEERKRQL